MNMSGLDWAIVAAMVAGLAWAALRTQRYNRSVAAFLAAERCAGRYLITVAYGMSQLGVITLVWFFESNYEIGYGSAWWPLMEGPAWIVMALSGWVIYRYRQTRAMTLAQFFEMRYSRNFRIFSGVVGWLSGIINFGIFPSVSARFLMALCGLPEHVVLGGLSIPLFPLLLFLLIAVALFFTFVGGQISVMITDFLQGTLANFVFVVLVVFLLATFRWERIASALLAGPPGKSLVHPFHLGQEANFNFWYYLIGVVIMFYGAMAWQGGASGYNCAARTAHEAKMAGILNNWRFRVLMLIVLVLPVCIRTMEYHPDFADQAARLSDKLNDLGSPTLQNQLRAPLAMAVIFPRGLLGLACAAVLAAHIGTHCAYLHSWGTILVQDVILPFRRRPLAPAQHMRALKASICAVACLIFVFSMVFHHTQYIAMFCALTASVFVGGAGAVIIGGLYWRRGTTPAAWAAMLTGTTASLIGLGVKQIAPETLHAVGSHPSLNWLASAGLFLQARITGQEMSFCAIALAVLAYVTVSLLGPRAAHDMDRLLHRGVHAVAADLTHADQRPPRWWWWETLGFSSEFSGADRVITCISVGWPLFWTAVFVVVTTYNLLVDVPDRSWLRFWHAWTWFIVGCAVLVTGWFTIGGFRDLRDLFRLMRSRRTEATDDGRVDHG